MLRMATRTDRQHFLISDVLHTDPVILDTKIEKGSNTLTSRGYLMIVAVRALLSWWREECKVGNHEGGREGGSEGG